METNNNCNIETTQNVPNKGKNIKKNYVLNLIYQITAILLPLIVTPYIARVLLPEGVGVYSFCFAIITYFTLIGFTLKLTVPEECIHGCVKSVFKSVKK